MAMRHKPTKIYVIFRGRNPGFYHSWTDCEAQVVGFSGAVYRAFSTLEEAQHEWVTYMERVGAVSSSIKGTPKSQHEWGTYQEKMGAMSSSIKGTPKS